MVRALAFLCLGSEVFRRVWWALRVPNQPSARSGAGACLKAGPGD